MPTPSQIKFDRVAFGIGSFEWLTHYGLPVGLLAIGFIGFYSLVKVWIAENQIDLLFLKFNFPLLLIGILAYWLQLKKLKFKSFILRGTKVNNRELIRKVLFEAGWKVEYDNQKYLIANFDRLFCCEQLILKYIDDGILWTSINHPANHNSLASLICKVKRSKEIISKMEKVYG